MGFISLAPLLSFHSHTPGYVISEWKHPKKRQHLSCHLTPVITQIP